METEPFGKILIKIGGADMLGALPSGTRRVSRIVGGTSTGGLPGEVLLGGSDWQTLQGDNHIAIDARFLVKTEHGTVAVHNLGFRRPDGKGGVYFRGAVYFEAPAGPFDWLNHTLFIASGRREGDGVQLDVEAVL